MKFKIVFTLTVCCRLFLSSEINAQWPEWRGPGDGRSPAQGLPVTWSETENIVWKTEIHDEGWSTPVIWGEQIWVTTATRDGHELYAVCLDVNTGEIIHDVKVFDIADPQRKHPLNSYATPSPVIEEGRVYVHYGSHGTACLDTQTGDILWTWDEIHCRHVQGPASSPFLFKDFLILHLEGNDVQYIVALDKTDAKEVWRAERPQEYYTGNPLYYKAYTTPLLIEVNGELQLVSNGSKVCVAYDPYTGEEIWRVVYGGDSTISRPIFGDGLVYVNVGWKEKWSELWAVRPDGKGNVTDTHVVWKVTEYIPIESSPVFEKHCIFTVDDFGMLSCLTAEGGEILWQYDLDSKCSASPIYADGRIYLFDKKNKGVVVKASKTFELLAENELDGGCMASPAVYEQSLVVRTKTHLYRIEQ